MQIVLVRDNGATYPVVELPDVAGSEITGPAFDPSGTRLYFSSQRNPGRTYEVAGSWDMFTKPGALTRRPTRSVARRDPPRNSETVGQPKPSRKWRSSSSNQWPGPTYVPCSASRTSWKRAASIATSGRNRTRPTTPPRGSIHSNDVLARHPVPHDREPGPGVVEDRRQDPRRDRRARDRRSLRRASRRRSPSVPSRPSSVSAEAASRHTAQPTRRPGNPYAFDIDATLIARGESDAASRKRARRRSGRGTSRRRAAPRPARSASSTSASSVARSNIVPVGLCGHVTEINRVTPGRDARRDPSDVELPAARRT